MKQTKKPSRQHHKNPAPFTHFKLEDFLKGIEVAKAQIRSDKYSV
jgi:hypothetical protein